MCCTAWISAVNAGEIVALLGRNGSGRSTTAKAIMGLVDWEGDIRWKAQALHGQKTYEVAHLGMGYVPESRDVFPNLTVHQNLLLGQKGSGKGSRWSFDDMYAMFPRLKERQHTEAGVMSGGEQQMLTLCRTLMGDPDLIIIDKPTEGPGAQDRRAGGRVPAEDQAARGVGAADRAEADHRHAHLRPRPGHGPRRHRVRRHARQS